MKYNIGKNSEKIISSIVLNYYKTPQNNNTSIPRFKCAWCHESCNRTGGGFYDKEGKPHQICEDCAVRRYKEEHGFKTLPSARARRRRIFDVGYFFNEIVLDLYMAEKGIKNFESCVNADDIFIKASHLYNQLFSKEDKITLEEIEDQKDIAKQIHKRLSAVDLKTLFNKW